jgi:hypothetical protein
MLPKNKPKNASKLPSSTHLMCSHTQADAEANTSTGLAEGSTMKVSAGCQTLISLMKDQIN